MPLYEYRCSHCGQEFDLLRSMAQADATATCPHCQTENVRRILSLFFSVSKAADGSTKASKGTGSAAGGSCASCSASSCVGCKP